MSYVLGGITIRNPSSFDTTNSTQVAQQRTLDGQINRDYFGDNKNTWNLNYKNVNMTDFAIIRAIYDSYLSTGQTVRWEVTETNYTVSPTYVHVDLLQRGFSVKGEDYLSDFDLILVEA